MDSYCDPKFQKNFGSATDLSVGDINNAYHNKGILSNNQNESRDLENLARRINNDKRLKTKDVYGKYRKNNTNIISRDTLRNDSQAFTSFLTDQIDTKVRVMPSHQSSNIGMANVSNCFSQCDSNSNNSNEINGFYSAQGDYLENKYKPENMSGESYLRSGTLIKNINSVKIDKKKKCNISKYDDLSLDTPSLNDNTFDSESSSDLSSSSNSSFSSLTWNIKEIDKQVKTKSKFDTKKRSKRHKCLDFDLNSVESLESLDSGESLLRHIRFCKECKDKVIDLIRKNKSDQKKCSNSKLSNSKLINELKNLDISHKIMEHMEKTDSDSESYIDRSSSTDNSNIICQKSKIKKLDVSQKTESYIPEIKEIITVCLIGFLIIMILDLMMRSK